MENERTVTLIYQKLPERGILRVAAYCRVSSSQNEQLHSLAAQINHYTQALTGDASCQFVGIYADEPVIIGLNQNEPFNRGNVLI